MSTSLFDLSNKTALITGACQGLGLAIAQGLGEAGCHVVINGRNEERVAATIKQLSNRGLRVSGATFDVTDAAQINQHVNRITNEIGDIDILINNAGIIKRVPLTEMEESEWREVIDTDLTAPFLMGQAVAKQMIARGSGKIINMCSMMSELGRNDVGAYAAAKGGLKMLTQNMATEWAKHGLQVNAIGPGYFETDITAPIRTDGHPFNDFIINRTPAGRWGKPEELCGTAIFLASDASNFVNGQVIYVDGGILATIGKPANEV